MINTSNILTVISILFIASSTFTQQKLSQRNLHSRSHISVSVLISPTLALYFACIDLIPRFAVSLAQLQDRLQPPATLNWINERKWMDEQRTQGKHRRYRKEALKTNGYQRDCASVTVSQSHFFKKSYHYVIKRHVCGM